MSNGEYIAVDNYASVGRRFVAIILDAIVFGFISYPIAAATGGLTSGGFEVTGVPAFLSFLLYFLYFVLMESFAGGTVGKLILGMKVRMVDGSPCTIGASLIRNLLRIVDALPGIAPYLLGAIFVWTSPTNQRLGDRLANTVVVRK